MTAKARLLKRRSNRTTCAKHDCTSGEARITRVADLKESALRCYTRPEIELLDVAVYRRDVLSHINAVNRSRALRHNLQLAGKRRLERSSLLRVLGRAEPFRATDVVDIARRVHRNHLLQGDRPGEVGVARGASTFMEHQLDGPRGDGVARWATDEHLAGDVLLVVCCASGRCRHSYRA
jgi:hypothetical protein